MPLYPFVMNKKTLLPYAIAAAAAVAYNIALVKFGPWLFRVLCD